MNTTELEFIKRVLSVTADSSDLYWHKQGDTFKFLVSCNDIFWWGCADAEEVTPENIDTLEQAYKDCEDLGSVLFCARIRKQRPQGGWFAKGYFDAEHMHWFEEFPEREVGLGNPYPWMSKEDYQKSKDEE